MGETYHRRRDRSGALVGLVVGVAVAASFVRWRPFRVEVNGPSMAPTLVPGDWALAAPARGRVRAGDIVVLGHPAGPGYEIVKRVVAGPGGNGPGGRELAPDELWVEGDNPSGSTDSRHFGPVRLDLIRARVRLIYWPPDRRRLLRRRGANQAAGPGRR